MNAFVISITVISTLLAICIVGITTWSIKSEDYKKYKAKIKEFDERHNEIKEQIKNDRKHFQ